MPRIFRGWFVVAGSALTIGFGGSTFLATGYTILGAALRRAFDWPASSVAFGATLFLLAQACAYPFCGWLVDRFGPRRMLSIGVIGFGLLLIGAAFIRDLPQLYVVLFLMGAVSTLTNALTYARAISVWFVRRRGFAIGLAVGGTILGAVLIPLGLDRAIRAGDWSSGWLAIGAFELLICLPIVLLLIHDSPADFGQHSDGDMTATNGARDVAEQTTAMPALTVLEAIRSRNFWMLAASFAMAGMAVFGVLINSVQILGATAGFVVAQVAAAQALIGVGTLAGRISVGYALDRVSPRIIGASMFVLTGLSIAGYGWFRDPAAILTMAFVLGFSIGGEADILPYLISRYFGVPSLGRIYGVIGACFAFGMMIGPIAFVSLASAAGAIPIALFVFAAGVVVASLAFAIMEAVPPIGATPAGSQS